MNNYKIINQEVQLTTLKQTKKTLQRESFLFYYFQSESVNNFV